MDYADFSEIALPNLTVTEANPGHVMAFHRFASDEVASFNRLQTDHPPPLDGTHRAQLYRTSH